MRIGDYAWRRSHARGGLVALLTAMAALIVLALAGTIAYLDVAATGGVREAIAGAPPTAQVLQVQTRLADGPQAQQEGAQAVFDDLLPTDAVVWTTIRTPPLPLQDSENRATLLVDPAAPDFATLTEGAWPATATETAVHAAAAETLGLAVGDVAVVTSEDTAVELTVVGLWQPQDPDDSHWAGDLTFATGSDPFSIDTYGPWLVTVEALEPLDVAPFVQWTIAPGPELTPESLDGWLAGLPEVETSLDEQGLTVRGVTTTGTLETTLDQMQESLASVRASSAIPMLIVALVSLVALWQIARLLAAIRERETLVLLSRGAAARQIVGVGAAEACLVAVGAVLGGAVIAVVFGGRPGYMLTSTVLTTVAVALVVIAVLLAVVTRSALTGLRPAGESGRVTAALTGGALVLVTALAAFTLWRFTRTGSPLVPGTQQMDVVAVGAPALALIAVALVAVALAGPFSRVLADAAARRLGYSPVTELRQASRRITVNAVPVVLVVLAASVATLASAYAGTWQALRTTSAQVSVGADVRVETGGTIVTGRPQGVAEVAEASGGATTGVLQAALRLDELVGQLSAFPMADAGVSSAPPELLDPVLPLLAPETDPLPGADLPAEATELTLSGSVSALGDINDGSRREVGFRVWLAQGADLVQIELGGLGVDAADRWEWDFETGQTVVSTNPDKGVPVDVELSAELPPGPWRLVAVDTLMETSYSPTSWRIEITALQAGGVDLLADESVDWDPNTLPMPGGSGEGYVPLGVMSFTGEFAGDTGPPPYNLLISPAVQRFMPENDTPLTVPVVTSPGWGGQIRPDGSDVLIGTTELRITQVGTMPVVPGNADPAAALTDLPTLQNALLRTADEIPAITQIWVDGGERPPTETADAVRAELGPGVEVVAAGDDVAAAVAAPARAVYWVAAACALLLALPAIAAVAMTQASARRGEVVVLRAVGVGAREQGRSRTRELLGLELGSVVAGVLAGALISVAIMVPLIRSTTPQVSSAVPLRLTFDWLPGALLVGLVVLTVTAVALWYGARVRAQARDTTWREEIR